MLPDLFIAHRLFLTSDHLGSLGVTLPFPVLRYPHPITVWTLNIRLVSVAERKRLGECGGFCMGWLDRASAELMVWVGNV